jgi:hypothetical protein
MAKPSPSSASSLSADIRQPRLRRLYDYWTERKGARRFPVRRDIDPVEFSYLLGDILLIEVLRDPLRFRARVHGSNLAARAEYELTGKLLDDLPINDYRNYVIERCRVLVETGAPVVVHHDRVLDGRPRRYEALWLPISEDGVNVTMLLCALIYEDRRW